MPKRYRVEIVPGAETDVGVIHDRIARDKPQAADRWAKRVLQKIRSLATFPERYEFIPEGPEVGPDFRHLIFGEYPIITLSRPNALSSFALSMQRGNSWSRWFQRVDRRHHAFCRGTSD